MSNHSELISAAKSAYKDWQVKTAQKKTEEELQRLRVIQKSFPLLTDDYKLGDFSCRAASWLCSSFGVSESFHKYLIVSMDYGKFAVRSMAGLGRALAYDEERKEKFDKWKALPWYKKLWSEKPQIDSYPFKIDIE